MTTPGAKALAEAEQKLAEARRLLGHLPPAPTAEA